MTAIGVDLGGTKILVAGVADDGTVGERGKRDTPRDGPASVVSAIAELVEAVGLPGAPVGIGTPGAVRPDGSVAHAPNLVGWEGAVPFTDMLRDAMPGRRVRVDNDVNAGALGEVRHGAAAGRTDLLCMFVGTGVGGGLVLDGELRRGPTGVAGEIGHVTVVPDGRRCGCGLRGHLEAYAGRAGMEAEARRRHGEGTATSLVERAGEKRMKSSAFLKAWEEGDALARELVDEAVDALAIAVAATAMLVDIDLVVLGGGVAEKFGDRMLAPLRAAVADRTYASQRIEVVAAALGDDAGVVGAAGLVSG